MTAEKHNPSTHQAWMSQAWNYFDAGNHAEAHKICLSVLQADTTQAEALHLMGVFAYLANDQGTAILLISEAIKSHNKHAPMHGNLALAKAAAGDLKGAAASCRKALALNPAYADAHRCLGIVRQKEGKFKEAVQEFQRALMLGLDTTEVRAFLDQSRDEQDRAQQKNKCIGAA